MVGAIIGAILVNLGKTWLTGAAPETWLFVLGALFVSATLVFPQGLVGLMRRLRPVRPSAPGPSAPAPIAAEEQA